mmetsp:Transcript_14066/g.18421  ORF Transcript_14066/g.18421 Transcript_14066/m.18421 type:complete len:319 (-) Transcript_14066:91-1047(-)|eukprot:CAMPEP_0116053468 /NCGR_PEP_ID=MMETSP0322-20121206/2202_1 /TAXON_ID=163516 /ORGANISM="Leptocylindrus danicus var. apora, Strain B651" /LENGTH=318 /DNA_ID=CAMNT_0003536631 /DNA_START=102 /DNA_END=1058 /DNA_ORIENTATION=+
MKLTVALTLLASAQSFTSHRATSTSRGVSSFTGVQPLLAFYNGDNLEAALERELDYKPGESKGDLAKRFGHLKGNSVRTVGEAFSDFTARLGCSINALYKNMVTDIVGSTHLTVVDARFQRDPVWSLGFISTMEFLLKNYPERDVADKIVKCMIESIGMDEMEVRAEANTVLQYLEGKSLADINNDFESAGNDSMIAALVAEAKAESFWMYSRFFGMGLVRICEEIGIEQDGDTVGQQIEKWMKTMEKPTYTAMSDSDQWFRTKAKLDMMETLMKEIEIREKKRMADRLEERAELAMKKAEREAEFENLEDSKVLQEA